MIEILLFTSITNIMIYSYGHLIIFQSPTDGLNAYFQKFFVGAIMLSFIALFMNFFLPLDRLFNSIILLSGVFILILKKKIKFEKVEICFLIIVSLLASLLILYSNVNRPDAGLYHLPYVSILNENKIIIGLSNLHFRFGHVSIIQYLSAINNNFILGENGIVIPLASIVSAFFVFFFNNVFEIFRKKEIDTTKIFSLFIIVFISYKINRYSSFGYIKLCSF